MLLQTRLHSVTGTIHHVQGMYDDDTSPGVETWSGYKWASRGPYLRQVKVITFLAERPKIVGGVLYVFYYFTYVRNFKQYLWGGKEKELAEHAETALHLWCICLISEVGWGQLSPVISEVI